MIEILAYVICGMWAVGCIIVWWIFIQDSGEVPRSVVVFIGLPITLAFGILPLIGVRDYYSPILVELPKAEWACSASVVEDTTTVIATGKTSVVVPTTESVCTQYNRKK